MSGLELMKRVVQNPQVRTLLLGHTHYNQLEVLQNVDELLPGQFKIDSASAKLFATLEVQNPVRAYSFLQDSVGTRSEYDLALLPTEAVSDKNERFAAMMNRALPEAPRVLEGPGPGPGRPRELVVLRLVS